MSTNRLPSDTIFEIFSYLSVEELETCCRVSKLWEDIAGNDTLWGKLFLNFPLERFPGSLNIRKAVGSFTYMAKSTEEMGNIIKKVAGKILCNQKIEPNYFFLSNGGSIELKLELENYDNPIKEPNLSKSCLFTGKFEGTPSAGGHSSWCGTSYDIFGISTSYDVSIHGVLPSTNASHNLLNDLEEIGSSSLETRLADKYLSFSPEKLFFDSLVAQYGTNFNEELI